MTINFNNINTVWSSIIVDTLAQLGVKNAVISPGSRSTALTIAFAQEKRIKTIPILDERSASFMALGMAKKANLPSILVCTSGTAGANFYPAIIEAKYSYIPLIILTADRPPELRECHGGQTINQVNLYGNYPNWQVELSLPSIDLQRLNYLRQIIINGWEKSQFPVKGVVHFNIPFREPLAPLPLLNLSREKQTEIINNNQILTPFEIAQKNYLISPSEYYQQWQKYERGIIIAGIDSPPSSQLYCQAIKEMRRALSFPVLAEALSPVRNYSNLNPEVITTYDFILRQENIADELIPQVVILIGEYPTGKILRQWLQKHQILTYIITPHDDNLEALHNPTIHLRCDMADLIPTLTSLTPKNDNLYNQKWAKFHQEMLDNINQKLANSVHLFEGKISWLLSQYLPAKTNIFIANSMSVRYAEYFWQKNAQQYEIYFSRGANGIDGTLSTALGIAETSSQPTILLTGDLALLHDTNGFLNVSKFTGSLTIILVNNEGGGIFEMLPIANFSDIFEEYFATPQNINFQQLANTYNINYCLVKDWHKFINIISHLPTNGVQIIEIQTDRKKNVLELSLMPKVDAN
ncbi:MAG: 2-succinyl-5-enolpyruvyl-6-hydroxy-3-cyclohexene-1-carboxylic-acid synthase [Cyanobacterium sp. T60_A2020_053]|nr:2-succinyl-5-enolpyruvyl-6-hydroxy-3-cyclohexene-1-carboxylic-acid synthase [Cyanobacterium sp. T60_A2020_053]